MSKNHSLDIKTIYQAGLIAAGIIGGILIAINIFYAVQVFKPDIVSPPSRIREQQLKTALELVEQSSLEN